MSHSRPNSTSYYIDAVLTEPVPPTLHRPPARTTTSPTSQPEPESEPASGPHSRTVPA